MKRIPHIIGIIIIYSLISNFWTIHNIIFRDNSIPTEQTQMIIDMIALACIFIVSPLWTIYDKIMEK